MENRDNRTFLCSRCRIDILQPIYVCKNGHLACEKCRKVFCQICRHLFDDRSEAIKEGEIYLASSTLSRKIHAGNPYEPNDGTIEFGETFVLPKRGRCRFYASLDDREFIFNWIMNPQEGKIEVDVSPKESVNENWFILEFALPSDEDRKMKKEWAVNHRLVINYQEVQDFYEMDCVVCKIHVHGIPYGNVVKPIEDKLIDIFKSIFFKPKNEYERL